MDVNHDHNRAGPWIGIVTILFGLLLLASHGNEALKQLVITPGNSAEPGLPADCRVDELEEEGLSLRECQLMVSSVQIILESSPPWFRSWQLSVSTLGILAAAISVIVGIGLVKGTSAARKWAQVIVAVLIVLDVMGFIAATNTGPLLRSQYLWPLLLWFFIHATLLAAIMAASNSSFAEKKSEATNT